MSMTSGSAPQVFPGLFALSNSREQLQHAGECGKTLEESLSGSDREVSLDFFLQESTAFCQQLA